MPLLMIGISGKKQSGKDTLIDGYINTRRSKRPYMRVALAGQLRKAVHMLFGIEVSTYEQDKTRLTHLEWENFDEFYQGERRHGQMTKREVLQIFGTNVMRKIYPDVWCRALEYEILNGDVYTDDYKVVFVSDIRFPNEIKFVLDSPHWTGRVIRLTRNVFDDQHISETALDDARFWTDDRSIIIDNANMNLDHSIQAFNSTVRSIEEEWVSQLSR